MILSQPRADAETRLARKSTGTRDADGTPIRRARSLRHSMKAQVVVPEDLKAIHGRGKDWLFALKPQDKFQAWATEQVAVTTLRIEHSQRIERRLRDRACLRAEVCWDADRRCEVEVLGAGIDANPAEVVARLGQTPHGCDWLLKRWAMLARAADRDGGWTTEQRLLAFRMLGTPDEFRSAGPIELIDAEGRPVGSPEGLAALARREIGDLRARRAEVADLDEVDRALAESDHPVEESAELRRVRLHQKSMHHHLRWLIKQVGDQSANRGPSPMLEGYFDGDDPQPEPAPPASSIRPIAIPGERREARLLKVEARRRARDRKLDRKRS